MRCFFAVVLPQALREALWLCAREGAEAATIAGLRAKPVECANMHLTIRFLGEVDGATARDLSGRRTEDALAGIRLEALSFQGVGAFPDTRRPKVVWAGVVAGAKALFEVHDAVEAAIQGLGVAPDIGIYRPHVTLLRLTEGAASSDDSFMQWLRATSNTSFGGADSSGLTLYNSTLTPQGPIYEPLAVFSLDQTPQKSSWRGPDG